MYSPSTQVFFLLVIIMKVATVAPASCENLATSKCETYGRVAEAIRATTKEQQCALFTSLRRCKDDFCPSMIDNHTEWVYALMRYSKLESIECPGALNLKSGTIPCSVSSVLKLIFLLFVCAFLA